MNKKFAALMTGLILATSMVPTGNAMARTNQSRISTPSLGTERLAITPISMLYFCAKYKSECAPSGRGTVAMTDGLLNKLQTVNSRVNRAIRPVRDRQDIWSLNPNSGDCEDYALSKRSALVRSGVPAGALRIAFTHRGGAPHAVLVVKTSEGDLVLDNLSPSVKTLRASGYRIQTMSSANPTRWIAG